MDSQNLTVIILQPENDFIEVVANDTNLKCFSLSCPVLPADKLLTAKLNQMSELFLRIYRDEWGEKELEDNTFWDILNDLDNDDIMSILTFNNEDSLTLEIVGTSIATYVSVKEMLDKMNAIITPTTGEVLYEEDISAELPSELIYFNEIFIDEKFRDGVAPFVSLIYKLTQGLLSKYHPETPVIFFTKGHSIADPNKVISVMSFATQVGMYQISLPKIEVQDRYIFWIPLKDLAITFEPPFTKSNLGQRILETKIRLDKNRIQR